MHEKLTSFDKLSLVEKRAAVLLGLRWQDTGRLDAASKEMARLRELLTPKARGYDGVAAIRRSRDAR